jgi:hypothetical protein
MKALNTMVKNITALLLGLCILAACQEQRAENSPSANLQIHISHYVGEDSLQLYTENPTYRNALGQAFSITAFRYYLSNFRLVKEDGSEWRYPQAQSYFLIDENRPESKVIALPHIPAGKYKALAWTIGVDSARSVAPLSQRTGVLDPAQGMYWAWHSGYIFLLLEGNATASSAPNGRFRYHIGLFGGYEAAPENTTFSINNLKEVYLPLKDGLLLAEGAAQNIFLKADVLQILQGKEVIDFAQRPTVMVDTFSTKIADNYSLMFSLDSKTKLQ